MQKNQTLIYSSALCLILFVFVFAAFPSPAIADKAIFAGGCFWCMEEAYESLPGVEGVISGFSGGTLANPTYQGNHRGHYEAVEVTYNPKKTTYQKLLDHYWINIDPFDAAGQFCDKGESYRAAIFAANSNEKTLALDSLKKVQARFPSQTVVTEILPAKKFWPVEAYHQDYYKKNPIRYKFYKTACGRPRRLAELWGKKK